MKNFFSAYGPNKGISFFFFFLQKIMFPLLMTHKFKNINFTKQDVFLFGDILCVCTVYFDILEKVKKKKSNQKFLPVLCLKTKTKTKPKKANKQNKQPTPQTTTTTHEFCTKMLWTKGTACVGTIPGCKVCKCWLIYTHATVIWEENPGWEIASIRLACTK